MWTCRGWPVTGRRRSDATSIGPIPVRLWCAAARPLGYGSKLWNIVNCTGHMVCLASLHVGGGVCASGKLALADISTRSTSEHFSAGRTVVPPRDVVGSRGCEIRALDFFSNRSEIGQASRQQLCPVACQISGRHDQRTRLISRLSGRPGFGGGVSCRAADRGPK